MSQPNMDVYFDQLEELYNLFPIWKIMKHLVFNLDETSLGCDRTHAKVFVTAGK